MILSNKIENSYLLVKRRKQNKYLASWLKCYYMQDKIGEIYEGTVAGVTSFGLFVSIIVIVVTLKTEHKQLKWAFIIDTVIEHQVRHILH